MRYQYQRSYHICINTQRYACRENLQRCGNYCSHYNYYNIQYTMLNHHFLSSPGRLPPGENIQYTMWNHHYLSSPGDFPRVSLPRTTPVDSSLGTLPRETRQSNPLPRDSEVPRIASLGFRIPPTTLAVFPASSQWSVVIYITQKGRVSPNSLYPSDWW